ncbi:MAG: FAD-dependent oxidoreductase [Zhenhengia sp.]|jgi:NADPH-dependent 2,4-dienoyl-CoA reductase/sulfur reductase-like enzyme|uniref:FAD-dependent oxidoreductase n=1 Tax=Zhenhengia sp. TaxID=2944208 RepID=UPI002908D622|nr:FAD-dependent oxidoreductase [Clostridiales bacterium]MDU6973689.1 FAD-dependent oxidoreductase [Clostridiales bacterium]
MKVIVIGCTHAGTAAIVNTKSLYKDAEVTVYEKNDNISFLSCGIALHVADVVKDPKGLFYNSPEGLKELGVVTKMEHEVTQVDIKNKCVEVKDLNTGEVFKDTYDKLIITLGSWPIVPPFEGIELENIVLSKNYNHSQAIIEKAKQAKNIVVIGAGYIGVELAEAFEMLGKNTTLVDAEERIMNKYLDAPFTAKAEEAFKEHGVNIATGEKVVRFEGTEGKVSKVITDKNTYEADLVVLCIGFKPNTSLVQGQLDMLPNGAIIIDEYMRTSEPDVFAAGDCCVVTYNPAGDTRYIPLATNAVRMGMLVARNLVEPQLRYMGTQGTSGIKIYDYNIASTGMTEEVAKSTTNYDVVSIVFTDNYRPEFMPTYEEAMVKLVYDKTSHRILGGQILSKHDLTQFMNTLSVVIQNNMTIEELAMTDFFFQPHFNKPWSLLNLVAIKAMEQ